MPLCPNIIRNTASTGLHRRGEFSEGRMEPEESNVRLQKHVPLNPKSSRNSASASFYRSKGFSANGEKGVLHRLRKFCPCTQIELKYSVGKGSPINTERPQNNIVRKIGKNKRMLKMFTKFSSHMTATGTKRGILALLTKRFNHP